MRVPKYYLVKNEILQLTAGMEEGEAVPTERELAERLDTSRTTVRQAIAELVVEGRLERAQGKGTFVAKPKLLSVRPLTSFSQNRQAEGERPGSVILDISQVEAGREVAEGLGVEPGTLVQRLERVRSVGDQPIAHEIAHLPRPLPDLQERLEQFGSLYLALAEAYDSEITTVEDVVETILADPVAANLLHVDTGLPLLLIHRTGWNARGEVVEWTRSAFRGDRFRFVARQHLDMPVP
ncbi:MAG: GntR family transcriptional regulator [Dermatophilus congolensis]|nr:GntR family transcriptional regulator [Dermatophilus congolensis]